MRWTLALLMLATVARGQVDTGYVSTVVVPPGASSPIAAQPAPLGSTTTSPSTSSSAPPTTVTTSTTTTIAGSTLAPTTTTGAVTTTTGATTTTLASLILPGQGSSDANCPATTPPVDGNNNTGWLGYVVWTRTCPAGANAGGYDVTAISVNVANAPAGTHVKCSVYDAIGPAHGPAGCDTVEKTLTLNPNAYQTMAITGACHLLPSTRYTIACSADSGSLSWGTKSGSNSSYQGGISYASLWPATLSDQGPNLGFIGTYLTVTATTGTVAASWVPSMLAAWMLDETTGNRVNAQGTTSRDASISDNTEPPSSTERIEGTRSMSITSSMSRHTVDTFASVVSPISMGCWVKTPAVSNNPILMHDWQLGAGASQLRRTDTGGFKWDVWDNASNNQSTTFGTSWATPVWAHVVGTAASGGTRKLYIDGTERASGAMTTMVARAVPFYLSDNSGFTGLLDECFFANLQLSATAVCRICSCGVRGEQCTCSGTTYASTGRNAAACNSCTLPADCSATTPP